MFLKLTISVLLLCTALSAVGVLLLYFRARGRRLARAVASLAIVAVISVMLAALWGLDKGDQSSAAVPAGFPFPPPVDSGYTSSDACRSCHPDEYSSWHATYHRTMTQIATPETVVASFDNVRLEEGNTYAVLERRGDEFWVDVVDPEWDHEMTRAGLNPTLDLDPPRAKVQIVMTTGSHYFQVYWFRSKQGRELWQFPWRFHIGQQRWVYRWDAFLIPPQGILGEPQVWNGNCIQCHSTGGQPGFNPDSGAMDNTAVAELGISCEACHGPGEEHVRVMEKLAERQSSANAADTLVVETPSPSDIAIVNPASLSHERSSHVCGGCHSFFRYFNEDVRLKGYPFRPGDVLTDHGNFVRMNDPRLGFRSHWADGTYCSGGREHHGLDSSACYEKGTLSCLSCHSMHDAPPNQLVADGMRSNEACLQCHEPYRDAVEQHTHHAADSSGSLCYNCHMPYTSYALLKAIRSHRIDSPRVSTVTHNQRPNACNLCHLDKTLAWSSEHLSQWYDQETPQLAADEEQTAASLLWLLRGDPVQRVVAAWHMGWEPARTASGEAWMAPFLGHLLNDDYAAVRWVAYASLRQQPGFGDFGYDFDAAPDVRSRSVEQAVQLWQEQTANPAERGPPAPPRGSHLLFDDQGQLDLKSLKALLQQRDPRVVHILE